MTGLGWRTAARAIWLGLVSGTADAAGWMESGLFPAHMTGNTALIGVAFVQHHVGLAETRAAVIACFFLGLVLSPTLGFEKRLGTSAAVWGASAVALAAALAPAHLWDVLLLSTALAMQNAALHRFAGQSINTSFLTGNFQSLGAVIARRALGRATPADAAADRVTLRVVPSVWAAYVAGAAIGAALALHLRHPLLPVSLAIPVVLLLLGRDGRAGGAAP